MSDKLDNALNAETIDWEQVVRIFRRLRGIRSINMYMCRIVPECSVDVVDTLMDHTRTKGYHKSAYLAPLISLIWTRILTGTDVLHNNWNIENEIKDDHELLPEWKETFLAAYASWEKVGNEIRVPNAEKVVEALSKTALIVRALPRPMNAALMSTSCKVSKLGNSKVRITQDPSMPIVHFFVFQNLPPSIVYLATLVYPEQLRQRDAWGNLPLHYANLSATEWTNWRPRFIPYSSHCSSLHSAAPLINLKGHLLHTLHDSNNTLQSDDAGASSSDQSHECMQSRAALKVLQQDYHDGASLNSFTDHLVHETAVPLLVTLYSQSVQSKCHAGRIPLQTYLLSLLDYRRQESQNSHILPNHPRTTWHFIQKDIELYLRHFPASVRFKDPQLHCFPFLFPALTLGSKKNESNDAVREYGRVRLLAQQTYRPGWDDRDVVGLPGGGVEPDDDDLRALQKPNEVVQDPSLDALVVSLTYGLLRRFPQVCELGHRFATDAAIWSMYERELHKRWKAKRRRLEDLEAGNKLLESKLQELLEINHQIKSTQTNKLL